MEMSSFALILKFSPTGANFQRSDFCYCDSLSPWSYQMDLPVARCCQIENWIKPEVGGDLLPMQQELDCGVLPSQWHNPKYSQWHNGTIRNIKFIKGRIGTNASIQMSSLSLKLQHIWKTPPKSGWWWLAGWLTVPLQGGKKHETNNAQMPRVT